MEGSRAGMAMMVSAMHVIGRRYELLLTTVLIKCEISRSLLASRMLEVITEPGFVY